MSNILSGTVQNREPQISPKMAQDILTFLQRTPMMGPEIIESYLPIFNLCTTIVKDAELKKEFE